MGAQGTCTPSPLGQPLSNTIHIWCIFKRQLLLLIELNVSVILDHYLLVTKASWRELTQNSEKNKHNIHLVNSDWLYFIFISGFRKGSVLGGKLDGEQATVTIPHLGRCLHHTNSVWNEELQQSQVNQHYAEKTAYNGTF